MYNLQLFCDLTNRQENKNIFLSFFLLKKKSETKWVCKGCLTAIKSLNSYLNGWTFHTFQKQRGTQWHNSMLSRAEKKTFNLKQRRHGEPLEIIIYGMCQILTFCLFIMLDYKGWHFFVTWPLNTVNFLMLLFWRLLSRPWFRIANCLLCQRCPCCSVCSSFQKSEHVFNEKMNLVSLGSVLSSERSAC